MRHSWVGSSTLWKFGRWLSFRRNRSKSTPELYYIIDSPVTIIVSTIVKYKSFRSAVPALFEPFCTPMEGSSACGIHVFPIHAAENLPDVFTPAQRGSLDQRPCAESCPHQCCSLWANDEARECDRNPLGLKHIHLSWCARCWVRRCNAFWLRMLDSLVRLSAPINHMDADGIPLAVAVNSLVNASTIGRERSRLVTEKGRLRSTTPSRCIVKVWRRSARNSAKSYSTLNHLMDGEHAAGLCPALTARGIHSTTSGIPCRETFPEHSTYKIVLRRWLKGENQECNWSSNLQSTENIPKPRSHAICVQLVKSVIAQ